MSTPALATSAYEDQLDRLVQLSLKNEARPFTQFQWPERLPEDVYWMPREFLSVAGTAKAQQLGESTLKALSKWESLNFYSMIVHGEKELIAEVLKRMHAPAFQAESEYLHHFVNEETEHMWYFAKFCRMYGGGLLPDGRLDLGLRQEGDLETFLVFCRVLMFEELLDYFNVQFATCPDVPAVVRDINRAHHQDESRHVAFGRHIAKRMFEELQKQGHAAQVSQYLSAYMLSTLELFYSSHVYERVGIAEPQAFRKAVMTDPGRKVLHVDWLQRTYSFFHRMGAIQADSLEGMIDGYFKPHLPATAAEGDKVGMLRDWLRANSKYAGEVTLDLDLLTHRVIDSLKFMQFLLVIEKVSGKEVVLEETDLNQLRTLRAISNNFLS